MHEIANSLKHQIHSKKEKDHLRRYQELNADSQQVLDAVNYEPQFCRN